MAIQDAHGAGAPKPSSVVAEDVLTPRRRTRARAGAAAAAPAPTFKILVTNQLDPYDRPLSSAALAALRAQPFAPVSDNFAGTKRKAAKLSIADGVMKSFSDLNALIATFPPDSKMINRKPKIKDDATSGRVAEEKRNVSVSAFLYAASRETDNDFHLIIGTDPNSALVCMTMEISALPSKNAASFDRIKKARDAFKTLLGGKLPGPSYHFYRPPIPVKIGGSLFFDITHATGGHPGPQDLRPHIPTIMEVHPVTKFEFTP